jgi:hypothetical protein
MALTVTSRGTGTHNTGAGTLAPGGRTATLAAGSMGVLCMALDNAGSAGASLIAPSTWTDAKGNVWTLRQNALYDNGAASAGIEMAIWTAPITVALLTGDAGTITWNGGSPVAKAWTWYEVIPSAGNYVAYSTGGTIAGATAANATVVTDTVPVGGAVIAGYFSENVGVVTGDSDTTNGTWTAQQTTTIGSTTSGVRIATQQKVQTTTPSTQTYNATVASQDRIAGYILLLEQATNRNGLFTATGGGVAAPTSQKGALVSVTVTGGGVVTWAYEVVSVENHDGSFTVTAGGVASVALTTDRLGAPTATGSGVVATAATTQRNLALSATGGGVASVAQSTERNGALSATGGGVVSASVLAARMGAAAMSGGGVFTTLAQTERFVDYAITGGGVVTWTGTTGEDRPGSFTATGGGAVAVSSTTDRLLALAATGGGAVAYAAVTDRLASFGATGGGRATLTSSTPPPAFVIRPDAVVGLSFTTDHVEIEEVP